MGNDIGEALDEGSVPALIMLDLSAAFHEIDVVVTRSLNRLITGPN